MLLRVFRVVLKGEDVSFFKVVKEFFDRLTYFPSLDPFALMFYLFSRAQLSMVAAEDVEDGPRTGGRLVHLYTDRTPRLACNSWVLLCGGH